MEKDISWGRVMERRKEILTKVGDQLGGRGGTEAISLLDLNPDETEGEIFLSGVAAVSKHEVAASVDDCRFLDSLGRDWVLANHAQGVEGDGLA